MSTTELIKRLKQSFDDYPAWRDRRRGNVVCARFAKAAGGMKWQRFQDVIARAEIACEQAGNNPADHFTGAGKMVKIGSETQRS